MGTLAEQLRLLNTQLGYAKESINYKYNIMDMPSIETLNVKELSNKIDDIPVINTKDATVTPSDIIKDKTAYVNNDKIIGEMEDLSSKSFALEITSINNIEFRLKNAEGFVNKETKFTLDKASIVTEFGVKPEIIKQGEKIFGIEGTYSGLDITKDATATVDDIVKDKTAYVNNKKIIGYLNDYSKSTVNVTSKLVESKIKITLPNRGVYSNLTSISISLSDIAKLINLSSDKIKEGEEVLGVIGTYSKPPEGDFVDYTYRLNVFKGEFKWGLWELSLQEKGYEKIELYIRLYNAYYYNGQCDGYYLNNDKSTIYAPTYDGYYFLERRPLSVYVYDLNLTRDECYEVWRKIYYDSPELIIKHTSFYINADGMIIEYMFLDTFDENRLKKFKETCLKSFNEICNKVKSTYGITYNGGSGYYDSVEFDTYTENQKFKIAKVIHDWLVLNNVYGHTDEDKLDQTMYSALCKGVNDCTPVCAGYGKAFHWCCQKFGIYTLTILGNTGQGYHLWNMICYEPYNNGIKNAHNNSSVWNEVDVTWDDPTWADESYCKWEYFNTTTAYMESNDGGKRTRRCYPEDSYHSYISRCSCKNYVYNGNVQYGGL